MYTLHGSIRKQGGGGPIGLKLTGVIAQVFMLWWDEELAGRLRTFGVVQKMNDRYVDDTNIVAKVAKPELRYRDGQVIMEECFEEEDKNLSPHQRTMELIKQIGNDIHPSIELEVDNRSRHVDGKLPILDSKVWIECREKELSGENGRVSKSFVIKLLVRR